MRSVKNYRTVTGAGIAALAVGATTLFGGVAVASAAPKDAVKVSASAHGHKGKPGARVTGEAAQKAIEAALAAVPGTADHAHETADGNYLVRVKTAEGKTVIVTLDKSFGVVKTQEQTSNGRDKGRDKDKHKHSGDTSKSDAKKDQKKTS
jgi:hypothetical protein